ncbi:MAG: GNAT family N-acetyltransferase [Gaiellaceae bacterium]
MSHLSPPELADDAIRLQPLSRALVPEMGWVLGDPDIDRFTFIPSQPDGAFLAAWLGRYENGWADGSCAGFAVREVSDGSVIGFAAFVQLDLDKQQGEIGYVVDAAARGRGVASRAVDLLTRWGFDELALERIELHIDSANEPSARVADRSGYRLEGVLRNTYFKEDRRSDVAIWARLRGE